METNIITDVKPNVQYVPNRVYIEPTNTGPITRERHPEPVISPIHTPCGRGPRIFEKIV